MKTKHGLGAVLAVVMLLSSAVAFANNASYRFIEGGYGDANFDLPGLSREDGFWLGFSFDLTPRFYASGSYEQFQFPIEDLEIFKFMLGHRTALTAITDLNIELGYNRIEAGDEDVDGLRSTVGFRSRLSRFFELQGYAGYVTDFSAGDFLLGVQGNIPFNDRLALTLQFETYEFDLDIRRVGLRLMF